MGLLRVWVRSRAQRAGARSRDMREVGRVRSDGSGAWQHAHLQSVMGLLYMRMISVCVILIHL